MVFECAVGVPGVNRLPLLWCSCCCCHHHRIEGDSHIELPCNEVLGEEKDSVVAKLSGAARQWWASVVAGGHSFEKPTFQLGLNGWSVTNILPDGAHERTPGRVELLPNGAAGFSQVDDSMCFKLDVSSHAALVVCAAQVLVVCLCWPATDRGERERAAHLVPSVRLATEHRRVAHIPRAHTSSASRC